MTTRHELDRIAVMLSFAEPQDLDVLREAGESLRRMGSATGAEELPEAFVRACEEAASCLESVTTGAEADADEALGRVCGAMDFAGEVLDTLAAGGSLENLSPPWDAASAPAETEVSGVDPELLAMFVSECGESLRELEALLLELLQEDGSNETVAEIRRRIHTFKGECGVLSLHTAQELCHEAETLIDESEESGAIPVNLLLDLVDWLRTHVLEIQEAPNATTAGHAELLSRLQGAEPEASVLDDIESLADVLLTTSADAPGKLAGAGPGAGESRPEGPVGAGGPGAILEAIGLQDNAEAVDAIIAEPSRLWPKLGQILLARNALSQVALREALERQQAQAAAGEKKPIGELLVGLDLITRETLAEALREQSGAGGNVAELLRSEVSLQPPEAASRDKPAARKVRSESLVRVGTQRLDALVDMVGELVIAQEMIHQDPNLDGVASEALTRKLGHVAKITRDLQEGAMSLRMVTLKPTFQKMARLVRDVAAKSGKQVGLQLTGEDTELDRNVVEHIGDPLVHLIRNSIDHGLEAADERVASGKSLKGTLELKAFHQGGSIVIEVRDDGRGLDCDRILAKAIERGLVSEGTTREELGDEAIHKMIFQAGFSTAAQVSDISGRGVGMDVVRGKIENMRGKVEITSKHGAGTIISLRLPLTLAIIDGMVVRVGGHRYVIPTLAIEQSFRPAAGDLHSVVGEGLVVDVRGALLPVHSVRGVFALHDGIQDAERGILILLQANHDRACFLVDEILGQQQVVIRSLGKGLPTLRGVSGGAILGDGRVALILDVEGLLSRAQCEPA